jgi:hypothetical protein
VSASLASRALVIGLLGCAPTAAPGPSRGIDVDAGMTTDAHVPAADAAVDPPTEDAGAATVTDAGSTGSHAFALTLETPDGECADLSVTERAEAAVRFVVDGRPGASVAIWADKPACEVVPFKYQELALDEAGRGTFELAHGGSTGCTDNLLGRWRVWIVDMFGPDESGKVDLVFASTACTEAPSCTDATDYCPLTP